jgi:hypothetical protein
LESGAAEGFIRKAGSMSAIGNMQRSSEYHQAKRLRPASDPAYLRQLAERMSVVLGLPLKVAKTRVERMAISATMKPASGRPASNERLF